MSLTLYDYFRSTAAYRVRLALNIKGLSYQQKEVHLVKDGGKQHSAAYREINPQALVPSFIDDTLNFPLTQSLAIIDYLEEISPTPSLFPRDIEAKYRAKQLAMIISCDIHPLNNLRVLSYLKTNHKFDDAMIERWYHNWLEKGFQAIEVLLQKSERSKTVCIGDDVSLADLCLIPQVYNAKRFNFNLDPYPLIREINDYCLSQPSFIKSTPEKTSTG
jgi:maleylacetoacetate isomerase